MSYEKRPESAKGQAQPEVRPGRSGPDAGDPTSKSARAQSGEWNGAQRAVGQAQPAAEAQGAPEAGGGLSPALREQMEAAFGADFSGVEVHTDSADAQAMGAQAFTRGEAVHFAPGEFQPGSREGQELIGHELAHVVQQRAGQAQPKVQRKGAGWVDDSQGLESEADAMGRRAAGGQQADMGGRSSASRAHGGVVQGRFTVSANVTATDEPTYDPKNLKVDKIHLPDQARPPTSLDKGRQGRHTIAWAAKIRLWQAQFAGALPAVLGKLEEHLKGDATVDKNGESATLRDEVQALVTHLGTGTPKVSEASHQLGQAISTYVRAYQKSSFAAFASVRPKGRSEATHLSNLGEWQERLKKNAHDGLGGSSLLTVGSQPSQAKGKKKSKTEESALTRESAMAAAWGLVDLGGHLKADVLHKLFSDWLELISTLYPQLFQEGLLTRPAASEIATIKTQGAGQITKLHDRMMGKGEALEEPELEMVLDEGGAHGMEEEPLVMHVEEEPAVLELDEELGMEEEPAVLELDEELEMGEELDPETLEAQEDEAVEAEQNAEGEAVEEAFSLPPFPVDVRMSLDGLMEEEKAYVAKDVKVESMAVANERLQTQFGRKQNSHTIPFSLDRLAWAKDFSGKSVEGVLNAVVERIEFEQSWGTEGPSNPTVSDRQKLLEDVRAALPKSQGISVWINELHDFIERYVTVSQKSTFATFGAEMGPRDDSDTARGHGEAAVLKTFRGWDAALESGDKSKVEAPLVVVKAQALVDVPQLDMNRKAMKVPADPTQPDLLKQRWLSEIKLVFPNVEKHFNKELGEGYDLGAVKSQKAKEIDASLNAPRASRSATKRNHDDLEKVEPVVKPGGAPRKIIKAKRKG